MFLLKVTLQWSLFIPYTLVFTVEHSSPVDAFWMPLCTLTKKFSRRCNVTVTTGPEDIRGCNWIPACDDPSSTGGWNRPYLEQLSHRGFYHFLCKKISNDKTRQKKAVEATMIRTQEAQYLILWVSRYSEPFVDCPSSIWVATSAQEGFGPSSQFFQLWPWLLVALGRLGLGLVAALLVAWLLVAKSRRLDLPPGVRWAT